jgi:putative endopeptidase
MPLRLTGLSAALLTLALAPAPALAQRATTPPAACADFYGHVNSTWLAQNPLPAGPAHFSRWDQLNAAGASQRDQMLNATTAPEGALVSQKLADLFASAQDDAAIEAAGTNALKPLFAIVDKIRRPRDIGPAIAALHAAGMPVLVDLQVLRDSSGNAYAQIGPGGIGLPDAGFYTAPEPEVVTVRNRYGAALAEWLRLTGSPQDKLVEHTTWVAAMELRLARATRSGTPFQVLKLEDAQTVAGQLDLEKLLAAHGLRAEQVALSGSAFLTTVNQMITEMKPEQWKVYLRAQITRDMAPALGRAFRDPWVGLYDEVLAGQDRATPRAVRARQLLEARVPELLDAAYMERFLPANRQTRGQEIAENVRRAAIAAVDRAGWLSAAGKAQAKARLQAMTIQVGRELPENVFVELKFNRQDLAGNVLALRRWLMKYAQVRAHFAWPAEQWTPLVAYMPQENRLVVTAATLQPPVLDDSGSAAGYGGLGALIAQQMMLGQQVFAGSDATAWSQRATPLIAQYNAYSAAGGPTKVNGTRSFVQNQADLAGLEIAWAALNAQATPDATAQQAFFAGWASMWARHDVPAALATAQATDQHAPSKWRVNGPLANLPAFAAAYGCKAGQPMLRPAAQQVALWR